MAVVCSSAGAAVVRRLSWLRRERRLSLAGAARAAGLSRRAWSRLEREGKGSLRDLERAAALFELEPSDLLGDPDLPPPLALPAPAGHAPIPLYTSRHLRVVVRGDAPCLYLPEAHLDRAGLLEPFAVAVDAGLADCGLDLAAGDILICERAWAERPGTGAQLYLVVVEGCPRLIRVAAGVAPALAGLGRIVGRIVGTLRLRAE